MAIRITSTQNLLPSLQSAMPSHLSLQDLTPATAAHETEGIRCFLYLSTKHSVKLRATQRANSEQLVVGPSEMAKLAARPEGQVDER